MSVRRSRSHDAEGPRAAAIQRALSIRVGELPRGGRLGRNLLALASSDVARMCKTT